MKLQIDDILLEKHLIEKKQFIGSQQSAWETLISFVLNMTSLFFLDISKKPKIVFYILIFISLLLVIDVLRKIIIKYTYLNLLEEIKNMDEVKSSYSLVAIKDSFNEYPTRFLVYYDEEWDCWFFPNYKTANENDAESVKERISLEIKIDSRCLSIKEIASQIITKTHPTKHINKNYHHTLYLVKAESFPENEKQDSFTQDGRQYKWLSIHDMEIDKDIWDKNGSIIAFIKENIP